MIKRTGTAILINCQVLFCSFIFFESSKRRTISLFLVSMIAGLLTRYSRQLSKKSLLATGINLIFSTVIPNV